MTNCCICGHSLERPLYESPMPRSLTSTGETLPRPHKVFTCGACGHLQTPPLEQLDRFYDTDYRILAESEDQDQVYEVADAGPVYRTAHQASVLQRLVELPQAAAVLEYGAGKAATLRHLHAARPDLQLHAFDVSRNYEGYWARFIPPNRCATHELPVGWLGHFDVVCAFFVVEHLAAPAQTLGRLRGLLKRNGLLYILVPDVLSNAADFLVAEHVNHFYPRTLREVAVRAGFEVVAVDEAAHQGALILLARELASGAATQPQGRAEEAGAATRLADYWRRYAERVRAFESEHSAPSAIYGAGFYGAHLLSCLRHTERVECFVDRNPGLHGRPWQGRPVIPPALLPERIGTIYAGVNPANAAAILASVPGWAGRQHDVFVP